MLYTHTCAWLPCISFLWKNNSFMVLQNFPHISSFYTFKYEIGQHTLRNIQISLSYSQFYRQCFAVDENYQKTNLMNKCNLFQLIFSWKYTWSIFKYIFHFVSYCFRELDIFVVFSPYDKINELRFNWPV